MQTCLPFFRFLESELYIVQMIKVVIHVASFHHKTLISIAQLSFPDEKETRRKGSVESESRNYQYVCNLNSSFPKWQQDLVILLNGFCCN